MRSAIAASDSKALMEAFTSAKDYRDSLTLHANGTLKQVYELYMDLLDEAGGIATVATILASHHLSIKNIGIIHNREFEDGVLHLEMYDSESLAAAITLLKKSTTTPFMSAEYMSASKNDRFRGRFFIGAIYFYRIWLLTKVF